MFIRRNKNFVLVVLAVLFALVAGAQSETRFIANPAGQSGNGYYTISFGEPVVGVAPGASTGFLSPSDTLITTFAGSTPVQNAYVKIFPNPVTTVLSINAVTPVSRIRLYDFSGKELETRAGAMQTNIDMSAYTGGTYLLKIEYVNNSQPTVARIVKQ